MAHGALLVSFFIEIVPEAVDRPVDEGLGGWLRNRVLKDLFARRWHEKESEDAEQPENKSDGKPGVGVAALA